MKRHAQAIAVLCRAIAVAALVAGCSTLEEEFKPVTESLHTPDMEAAINSAKLPPRRPAS